MAQTEKVTVRIDEDVKRDAERALNDMGLTLSAAITLFLTKVGKERRIPFEISADPFYSESNIRYLEGVFRDVKEGKEHLAEHDLIETEE